ncbi:MAG: tetratricopeptide repeat protein, partial [Calditrichia bacterium]
MNHLKTNLIITLFILAFLSSCAYYNTLFNAKNAYQEGIEIIQKEPEKENHPQADRFFEATIEKCWKLLEIYGEDSKYADDAFLYIIKSEYYLKNYAQARQHANQFLSKYPESELIPEVYLWLGKVLLDQEERQKGTEFINRSLAATNDSKIKAQVYYELGNLAFKDSSYQKAVEEFEKALDEKIDEQYAAFIQFYLGESYYHQQQYKEAIPRYKRVEKYSPSLDVEYKTKFNLARSYSEL